MKKMPVLLPLPLRERLQKPIIYEKNADFITSPLVGEVGALFAPGEG